MLLKLPSPNGLLPPWEKDPNLSSSWLNSSKEILTTLFLWNLLTTVSPLIALKLISVKSSTTWDISLVGLIRSLVRLIPVKLKLCSTLVENPSVLLVWSHPGTSPYSCANGSLPLLWLLVTVLFTSPLKKLPWLFYGYADYSRKLVSLLVFSTVFLVMVPLLVKPLLEATEFLRSPSLVPPLLVERLWKLLLKPTWRRLPLNWVVRLPLSSLLMVIWTWLLTLPGMLLCTIWVNAVLLVLVSSFTKVSMKNSSRNWKPLKARLPSVVPSLVPTMVLKLTKLKWTRFSVT